MEESFRCWRRASAARNGTRHNHFNQERYLYGRRNFKANRIAALAEWRQLCSA